MDLTELYYTEIVGHYPGENDDFRNNTKKIIEHLSDAGIPQCDIVKVIEGCSVSNYITPDMLPDWLWVNSLIRRDTFYYHNTLQLVSQAPVFSIKTGEKVSPFYLEMKIKYLMKDLISYFYKKIDLDTVFIDNKRDAGGFEFLLNRYKGLSYIEPLDFILALIDYAASNEDESNISSIFDIRKYEQEVGKILSYKVLNAERGGFNRIIWR